MDSVFDELELVMKMTISSKNHKEKHQTRTKKYDARMQMVWALNEWYDQASHLRAPIDSTTIYPKIENLSRANLYLAPSPLELDDDDLGFLKMDHLSWLLPHTHYGWATLQHIFTSPLPPQWTTSFKHDIFVMLHLNLHTAILMTITTWCHPPWVVWDLPLDASPWKHT